MRLVWSWLAALVVLFFVSETVANNPAAKPVTAPERAFHAQLVEARAVAFDTAKNACEQIDIPDAAARAFRDYQGTVHLIASHYRMRQNLGPTLGTVKHSCQVVYDSKHDGNPADFDDATWLDSFYNIDGKKIIALGHMEYHGWEHAGQCKMKTYNNACWYNVDTFHLSLDGGYHFGSAKAPGNFVAGLPYKYEVNKGPEGVSIDTNILKVGEWYYAMLTGWGWPAFCQEGNKAHPCLAPFGGSLIRTSNILDPASWRAWDGKDFSVSFVDPYRAPVTKPAEHIYTTLQYMWYVNAINYHEASKLFVATLFDPFNTAYGPEGLYLSTSADLIHWSKPVLVITVAQLKSKEPKGNWSYAYFSLIDPQSKDPNFATIGDSPYLYYVRSDENHGPYARVLFRQRLKLTWK
jgi:hypothetical protein